MWYSKKYHYLNLYMENQQSIYIDLRWNKFHGREANKVEVSWYVIFAIANKWMKWYDVNDKNMQDVCHRVRAHPSAQFRKPAVMIVLWIDTIHAYVEDYKSYSGALSQWWITIVLFITRRCFMFIKYTYYKKLKC